jgi:outer membrane receptor protein involved in Fe transport
VGARYDRRSHTGDSDVSPRLHASYRISDGTTVRASVGEYRQSHGVEELSVVDGDTIFFPSEVARQVAVGVEHRFGSDVHLRLEGYARRTDDPRPRWVNVGREIIPFPEIGNDRVRILPDRARASGLEIELAGPLGSRTSGSASYVLARTEDRIGGVWTPRTLDQRHTIGLRWHFDPNDRWTLSAGWQFHTGWPSTPMEFQVDTISSADPNDPNVRHILITETPGAINSDRLPSYHRLDFRVTRTFTVGRGRLDFFLDIFNMYNRENLRSYEWRVQLPEGRAVRDPGETLLPLLPSFGLTWTF